MIWTVRCQRFISSSFEWNGPLERNIRNIPVTGIQTNRPTTKKFNRKSDYENEEVELASYFNTMAIMFYFTQPEFGVSESETEIAFEDKKRI